MNQKWYEKNVAIILSLIFFFPVGLFLMWKYSNWNKIAKIIVSVFIGIAVIGNIGSSKTNKTATTKTETVENIDENKITEIEQPKETKKTGWIQENGDWHYYSNDGETKTGWIEDNNKHYYLNTSGIMQKGWIKDNGKDYYLDNSGVMQTGWKESNNKWYYLNTDGSMATNTTVDGCKLASNGAMQEKVVSVQPSTNDNTSINSNSRSSTSNNGDVTTNEPGQGNMTVYWTSGGKSYHYNRNCRSLARSKNVSEGPASSCPKTDPCNNCVK